MKKRSLIAVMALTAMMASCLYNVAAADDYDLNWIRSMGLFKDRYFLLTREANDALADLNSIFDKDVVMWVASIYDPDTGGFHRETICVVVGSGDDQTSIQQAADTVSTLLREAGILTSTITGADVARGALQDMKLAIFPYNPGLTTNKTLEVVNFLKGGGKILVFYSLPAGLDYLLGLNNVGWKRQDYPRQYSEIRFDAPDITGLPAQVDQASWNITVVAINGPDQIGHLVAGSTSVPQWVKLQAPSSAQGDVARGLLASADHKLTAAQQAYAAGEYLQAADLAATAWDERRDAYLLAQPARDVEFRGCWNHSGTGAYATWEESILNLKAHGFNAVLPIYPRIASPDK